MSSRGRCQIVAIGFTVIFILGQLDLSIGAVVMLCGMLTIGLQPQMGWFGAIMLAVLAGASVGLVNGLLVVKARVNSFIVTLGTMTVVTGLMHLYSKGGSKAIDDFRFADWLETPLVPFIPPIVIIVKTTEKKPPFHFSSQCTQPKSLPVSSHKDSVTLSMIFSISSASLPTSAPSPPAKISFVQFLFLHLSPRGSPICMCLL